MKQTAVVPHLAACFFPPVALKKPRRLLLSWSAALLRQTFILCSLPRAFASIIAAVLPPSMALPAASHQEGACAACVSQGLYVHLSITTASGLLWNSPNNKNEMKWAASSQAGDNRVGQSRGQLSFRSTEMPTVRLFMLTEYI